ncbi:SMODS domain-containing nucleotidyltransferase, partial [Kushneria avicenniae]
MSRQAFSEFRKKIAVDNAENISASYKKITRRLNIEFYDDFSSESHSRQVGSYGRHTAIKGISDLDMIFELPDDLYDKYNKMDNNGQYKLLSRYLVPGSNGSGFDGTCPGHPA